MEKIGFSALFAILAVASQLKVSLFSLFYVVRIRAPISNGILGMNSVVCRKIPPIHPNNESESLPLQSRKKSISSRAIKTRIIHNAGQL